ncbi:hypothetical protein ONA91_10840 [Micromonospora sp. DR5-3]|uniref:hypothetical protein n=1 Tax=unclassified Micromonospora TaxID=2617518 RepID=UPI001651F038|nr:MULTISPECIES: hypothetical protein [unclassified Micromonospora]MCW3814951.1 hypothetical protein [Micromonospora sp. DR5-3]
MTHEINLSIPAARRTAGDGRTAAAIDRGHRALAGRPGPAHGGTSLAAGVEVLARLR